MENLGNDHAIPMLELWVFLWRMILFIHLATFYILIGSVHCAGLKLIQACPIQLLGLIFHTD